jgi:hypothetical protein
MLGDLVERVDLRPGEDALAVGHGRLEQARARADRDDERVGVDLVEVDARLAAAVRDDDALRAVEAALTLDDAHAGLDQLALHVLRLLARETQQPRVDGGEVDGDLRAHGAAVLAAGEELHAEVGGLADGVRGLRRGDERLRRHDVGEHGRAADTGALDEGDLRAELGSGERRLVSAWPPTEYGDALLAFEFIGHDCNSPPPRAPAQTGATAPPLGAPRHAQ